MSKRQDKRIKRGAGPSRPNRRAAERLSSAIAGFEVACKVDKKNGAKAYKKPGAKKCW